MDSDKLKKALNNICKSLLERADNERRKTDAYKEMFIKSEYGLRECIDQTCDNIRKIVYTLVAVIENKTQKTVSFDVFQVLCAAPFVMQYLREYIQNTEGDIYCADKAREIFYKWVMENLKDF